MRKFVTALFIGLLIVTAVFTLQALTRVLSVDMDLPTKELSQTDSKRLVLITDQIGTPFYDQIVKGAKAAAIKQGMALEVLGYANQNDEALLTDLERAIYAKVDGIIVQGKDTEAFKELTKVKAAFYSIPVVTISEDVPIEESLRRTYVGSNHFQMGQTLANVVTEDYQADETVVIYYDETRPFYQRERLRGAEAVLNESDLTVRYISLPSSTDEAILATQRALNQYPTFDAVMMLDAKLSPIVIEEIKRRRQIEPLGIYTFDEQRNLDPLLKQE